ncbi:MAG: transcriptional regulator GcvA [Proteobacteria bacterium]|nr:transcriptional regulator GcvA [Pseudomonadota bacterium]
MTRLPPFMALRALEAATRLRSYTRAAEELHVTHGAVSHQIRRLEEEFGLKLFRREGNAMAPTEPALKLAAKVAQAIRLMQQGADELSAQRGAKTLVISTLQSFAIRWLAPRLAGFAEAAPEVEVEVRTDDRLADFVHDGVDVAIRYGSGGWPGVEARELFSERLFPVCSPAFLKAHPLERMEDLGRVPLLRHNRRAWALWFRSAGLDMAEPTSGLVFDDSNLLIAAAANGLGVALAPSTLAESEIAAGRLVRPFPVSVEAEYGYFLVWRADSRKGETIARFRDWMLGEAGRA